MGQKKPERISRKIDVLYYYLNPEAQTSCLILGFRKKYKNICLSSREK